MSAERRCEILVTGGRGQLGTALSDRAGVVGVSSAELDLASEASIRGGLEAHRPRTLVNAAAYTGVDAAESEVDLARQVNGHGVRSLAEACRDAGVDLVHVSTDFVFDGTSSRPIPADATPNPVSAYGRSKLEGEVACREVLGDEALIVRTAWVYASGHANFVATMLRLMRTREEISVVADQIGTPTWAETLADGILGLVAASARGTHHLTDAGVTSWYDFAVAIEEIARDRGLLERPCRVRPIRTEDYPTPATRPAYGVLDKTATFAVLAGPTPHWRESLDRCLADWRDPE